MLLLYIEHIGELSRCPPSITQDANTDHDPDFDHHDPDFDHHDPDVDHHDPDFDHHDPDVDELVCERLTVSDLCYHSFKFPQLHSSGPTLF